MTQLARTILDVLKDAATPLSTKELWQAALLAVRGPALPPSRAAVVAALLDLQRTGHVACIAASVWWLEPGGSWSKA